MNPPDAKTMVGAAVVVAFLAMCFTRVVAPNVIPDDVFYVLIGALAREFAGVVGYYFGTTKQSTAKDETISKLAGKG